MVLQAHLRTTQDKKDDKATYVYLRSDFQASKWFAAGTVVVTRGSKEAKDVREVEL